MCIHTESRLPTLTPFSCIKLLNIKDVTAKTSSSVCHWLHWRPQILAVAPWGWVADLVVLFKVLVRQLSVVQIV